MESISNEMESIQNKMKQVSIKTDSTFEEIMDQTDFKPTP